MGKSLGSNIKEGKQTYMVIKARRTFQKMGPNYQG